MFELSFFMKANPIKNAEKSLSLRIEFFSIVILSSNKNPQYGKK